MRRHLALLLSVAAVALGMLPVGGLAFTRQPPPLVGQLSSPGSAFGGGSVSSCAALTTGDTLEGSDVDGANGSSATLGDFFNGDGLVYQWSFDVVRMFGSTPAVELFVAVDTGSSNGETPERGAGLYLYGAVTCNGDVATITGRWLQDRSYSLDPTYSFYTDYVDCNYNYGAVTGGGNVSATLDISNGTLDASLYGSVGFQQTGSHVCEL